MKRLYHVTPSPYARAIVVEGLKPVAPGGERAPRSRPDYVYLFTAIEDAAHWGSHLNKQFKMPSVIIEFTDVPTEGIEFDYGMDWMDNAWMQGEAVRLCGSVPAELITATYVAFDGKAEPFPRFLEVTRRAAWQPA